MSDALSTIWDAIAPAHEFIGAVSITLLSSFLLWLFKARVKLIWGSTSTNFHKFKLRQDADDVHIWTEKFYVQNVGKKAAHDIEIVFSSVMNSYNLWPPRDHTSKLLGNGNFVIQIPSLAPRELLVVDMIDVELRNPDLLAVNCPEALAKGVKFVPTRQFGRAFNALIAYLMIAGLVGTFYFLIQLLGS
ncbi:hypothetical protein [Thioclava nitratireducens]|uniref:hypothetical protein n=1 Tax=Thioclava nitratireducens TaxID=1915078 RepID=UPI0024804E25|nr:hypothetical protein [Thioclava nitratireducens]WGT49047.1 hypothetical protein P0N61_12010 [Thioclava nitratireducens]